MRPLRLLAAFCLFSLAMPGLSNCRAAEPNSVPTPAPTDAAPGGIKSSEKLYAAALSRFCQTLAKTPDASPVPVDLGGWPALQVPACAVTGLVLLGEGNTLSSGAQSAVLNKLFKYTVLATQGALAHSGDKDSWLLGFGILFLAEVQRASPSQELKEHLARLVARLESGQNGENGWRHGLAPDKGETYGPFIGVTMWCAAALGSAKEAGVPVTEENLNAALRGLKRCVLKFGGASYYAAQASRVDPGRSGGILWVLRRYDPAPEPEAGRAQRFMLDNVEYAHQGHGSQVMGFGRSALAAAISGPEAATAFWNVHFQTLKSACSADGAFLHQDWKDFDFADAAGKGQPRERKDNTTWPDKMYGSAWTGAWMLLSWQSGLGRGVLIAKPAAQPALPPEPAAQREKRAAIAAAEAEAVELLKAGKSDEAAKRADAALKDNPGHAGLLVLRAMAALPALAQEVGTLEAKSCADGTDGWGAAAEARALSFLDRALRAREGKGLVPEAYDAEIQLLAARIHGKRVAVSAQAAPKSPAWVPLYNIFAKSVDGPLKSPSTQQAASRLLKAVMNWMPKQNVAPPR